MIKESDKALEKSALNYIKKEEIRMNRLLDKERLKLGVCYYPEHYRKKCGEKI